MGQLWGTCIKRSSKHKDTKSPYKVSQYILEAISEFCAGGFLTFFIPFFFAYYVGINDDPTLTVAVTNQRNALILSTFFFSVFTVFCIKGSFGQRLCNVFGNSWLTLMSAVIAVTDYRVRIKELWIIGLPIIDIGFNVAGTFAGVATWLAVSNGIVIPPLFVPTLANTIQQSYGWSILIGTLCYCCIFHVFIFTCNGTRSPYSNLWPLMFVTFLIGTVQVVTIKQFPSFAMNLGVSYLTGHYELLWVDVVNGFIALAITWFLYFFVWSIFFEPDQVLQVPNYQIPWDFSAVNWKGHKNVKNATYARKKSDGQEEISLLEGQQAASQTRYNSTKSKNM